MPLIARLVCRGRADYSSSSLSLRRNRLKSVKPISAARKPRRTSVVVGEGVEVK